MTKCWFEYSHKPPCEWIYFVRKLGSSQGHHRSWAQTGRGGVCGVARWRIRFNETLPDVSLPNGSGPASSPNFQAEWFIQMFPCNWSHCGGLEMTNDSEGFSFRDLGSSGRKKIGSIHSKMTNSEAKYGTSITFVHLSSCDLTLWMKQFLNLFYFFSDVSENHTQCPSPWEVKLIVLKDGQITKKGIR